MSSASKIAPTFSDTNPQSAWVTPSGLSMAIRTNRALPPPLTSTSTSSRPSDCATCCAISSIFAATTSRIVTGIAIPNKKVGVRPLRWLDNSIRSVPCLFELRKGGIWGLHVGVFGHIHRGDEEGIAVGLTRRGVPAGSGVCGGKRVRMAWRQVVYLLFDTRKNGLWSDRHRSPPSGLLAQAPRSTAVPMVLRRQRHFDELIASRCRRIDFGRYRRSVVANDGPDIGAEHDQSELPARQILLVPDVLIGRNHHVEPRRFRHLKKLPVFKLRMPLHLYEGADLMFGQEAPYTDRDVFVKYDAQCGDSWRKSKSPRYDPAEPQTVLRFRRRSRHSRSYRQSR